MDVLGRIVALKKERNISTNKLAKLSGLSQATVQSIVKRGNLPSIPTLECLVAGLGLTLHDFFAEKAPELSNQERRLLAEYKCLSAEKQAIILTLVSAMNKDWTAAFRLF